MKTVAGLLLFAAVVCAQSPGDLAAGYLRDLIRIDTSNPPGRETPVANYLKQVADREGIPSELVGDDPQRMNFIARLRGSGRQRPLLLIAHSDVVPVDRSQWTVDAFSAVEKNGFIYGRGAEDDKDNLAAELAVMVDLHRRHVPLSRDIILLSEADEESGSLGMTWVIAHAWPKIDAEFALNEFSYVLTTPSGIPVYQIETAQKVPTRVRIVAHGTAGHASIPRDDNAVVHLARAIVKLSEAEQPVQLSTTTRTYFERMSTLPDYAWLAPLLPKLESSAAEIRKHNGEWAAMLQFTLSPTMLNAGIRINVIPNTAEAQVDGRRLPGETRDEIFARLNKLIGDPAVTLSPLDATEHPATEPSSLTSPLYIAMEEVFKASAPNAVVVPYLMRATTDGAYLRAKGMAVYGMPLFRLEGESRAHGNDERISLDNLRTGVDLLLKIVLKVGAAGSN